MRHSKPSDDPQSMRQRDNDATRKCAVQRAERWTRETATRLHCSSDQVLRGVRLGMTSQEIDLMSAASFATATAGRKPYPTNRDGIAFLRAARAVFADPRTEAHQQFEIMNRISQRGVGNAGLSRDAKRRLNVAVERIAA